MGRKGNWFSNVKKALSPESKERKDEKLNKSKKKWFGKQQLQTSVSYSETDITPSLTKPQEVVITHVENEKSEDHVVDEGPFPAVHTIAAVVQASTVVQFASRPKDDVAAAAITIQTAFRGYLARRGLRSTRGLVRLKSLMEGPVLKGQAFSTLRAMHSFGHLQSQIRSRRLRMLEENQATQKQLLQKHAKELERMRIEEEWDDSLQSKEQIEAKLLSKYEAALRREKALAYSFSHQQNCKNSSRSINPMFMDPTNPSWGWSWLERWTATHPWESHSLMEKEKNDDGSSAKSSRSLTSEEIRKSFARFHLNSEKHSPTASQNPGSPNSQQSRSNPPKPAPAVAARKPKKASPKDSRDLEDDTKSMRPGGFRRHSIAGSIVRDDDNESLPSSPTVPSYMVATKSAKAKSKMMIQTSPLATIENSTTETEKGSFGTVKKQLTFPASPARPRRHSGPPKVET